MLKRRTGVPKGANHVQPRPPQLRHYLYQTQTGGHRNET